MKSYDIETIGNFLSAVIKFNECMNETLDSLRCCELSDIQSIISVYSKNISEYFDTSSDLIENIRENSELENITKLREWCNNTIANNTPVASFVELITILLNLQNDLESLLTNLRFFVGW